MHNQFFVVVTSCATFILLPLFSNIFQSNFTLFLLDLSSLFPHLFLNLLWFRVPQWYRPHRHSHLDWKYLWFSALCLRPFSDSLQFGWFICTRQEFWNVVFFLMLCTSLGQKGSFQTMKNPTSFSYLFCQFEVR